MSATVFTNQIKAEARRLGFAMAGVCPAVESTGISRMREWLERGYAGEMHYLKNREAAYRHPSSVLEGVKSILVLAMHYRTEDPAMPQSGEGRVARYAWGRDYHDLIRERLNQLVEYTITACPGSQARGVVDTAPLLERELAQRAGLGWIGKNTLLLNQQSGSWFFLSAMLTTIELEPDAPQSADHCGTCTACLDACPTQAFPQPYVLDARRCISYLTIEHRSAINESLSPGIGDWVFGCDICQEVCPWNRFSPRSDEADFAPTLSTRPLQLLPLFRLSDEDFRTRFRGTSLWRAKRGGLLRNAAIVLGNQRNANAVEALSVGLNDADSLVRGASAWALGQISSTEATKTLRNRLPHEPVPEVRQAIEQALGEPSAY